MGACGERSECPTGDEACLCYSNGTCNGTLVCSSSVCVDPGSGSAGADAGRGGAGGAAGGSGGDAGAPDAGAGQAARGGSGAGSGGTRGGAGGTGNSGGGPGQREWELRFFDDFEDGDTEGWTFGPTPWTTISDADNHALVPRTGPDGFGAALIGETAWTDQWVEARVRFVDVLDDFQAYAAVGARFESMANGAYLILFASGTGQLSSVETVDDMTYNESVEFMLPVGLGEWYTLAILAEGTTLTAYVDGVEVAVFENTTRVQGRAALSSNPLYGTVHFDDFAAYGP